MKFKKLADGSDIDLATYLKNYIKNNSNNSIRIYVGCDSHVKGEHTTYVSTVVIHVGNSGCHVLYKKEKVDPIRDLFRKLWGEVERSVEVTLYLRENGINIHTIDLDLNHQEEHASNKVVNAAMGYVKSLDIKVRIKPDILPAIAAADNLSK
jgi:predicted RNase H-related nuclease YkuK (DUF458 family)|tara:strand:- start:1884 stop:2339 length:456 start_codon:yes stop_codon:yes gene_type:complete